MFLVSLKNNIFFQIYPNFLQIMFLSIYLFKFFFLYVLVWLFRLCNGVKSYYHRDEKIPEKIQKYLKELHLLF